MLNKTLDFCLPSNELVQVSVAKFMKFDMHSAPTFQLTVWQALAAKFKLTQQKRKKQVEKNCYNILTNEEQETSRNLLKLFAVDPQHKARNTEKKGTLVWKSIQLSCKHFVNLKSFLPLLATIYSLCLCNRSHS